MRKAQIRLLPDADRGWIYNIAVEGKASVGGDALTAGGAKRRAVAVAALLLDNDGEIEVIKHSYLRRPRVIALIDAGTVQ